MYLLQTVLNLIFGDDYEQMDPVSTDIFNTFLFGCFENTKTTLRNLKKMYNR